MATLIVCYWSFNAMQVKLMRTRAASAAVAVAYYLTELQTLMAPATTDPRRRWGALFWSLIAALAITGFAFTALPELAQQARSIADRFVEPVLQAYQAWMPSPLQPLVIKAASVFLTPWLYVVMLIVFIAERYIPADRTQRVFSIGMLQDFIAWFALDGLVHALVVGTLVTVLYKLYPPYQRRRELICAIRRHTDEISQTPSGTSGTIIYNV